MTTATTTFVAAPPEGLPTIDKDPDATLDYAWEWSDWLAGDSISSHTVTVSGVTKASDTRVGTKVTAWISGGTVGTPGLATCTITTAAGRIEQRSIAFRVLNR